MKTIEKTMFSCTKTGEDIENHFVELNKMVKIGSGRNALGWWVRVAVNTSSLETLWMVGTSWKLAPVGGFANITHSLLSILDDLCKE